MPACCGVVQSGTAGGCQQDVPERACHHLCPEPAEDQPAPACSGEPQPCTQTDHVSTAHPLTAHLSNLWAKVDVLKRGPSCITMSGYAVGQIQISHTGVVIHPSMHTRACNY